MTETRVAVIGCGNPNRSDDGAGPHVVALLRGRPLPETAVLHDAGTDGMGVMYAARGASHLIVVDARAPEAAPGALYEVPGEALAAAAPHAMNLHDFRWDHALHAGRLIYGADFPAFVKVLLIEAETLVLGVGLSPAAAATAGVAADRIVALAGAADAAAADGGWT